MRRRTAVVALLVVAAMAVGATAAPPAGGAAAAAKSGDKPGDAPAGDAELQTLAKKLGQQLNTLSASVHRGPAQDSDIRVAVLGVKAVPVGGDSPGAKLKMDLRVTETQLQGGDFVDCDFAVDIDLRRAGDKWTCAKAMATPGTVSTKFGPEVGGAPQESINITGDVQRALVKIGAAESPALALKAGIVKWVSENNSLGAGSPIGDDMGKLAEPSLAAGQNVGILLGPGLMKSGKATRVGVFCGQMYVVEYTDAQAKQAGLQPNTVVKITDPTAAPRRLPPDAELGKPDFGATPLDLGAGVKGKVTVRAKRRLPQADYIVRLSYNAGGQNISSYHHLGSWLLEKEKPVEFKFGSPGGEAAKQAGPLVVFMDLCEMTPDGNGGESVEVISPTTVMVVDVKPAGAAKP